MRENEVYQASTAFARRVSHQENGHFRLPNVFLVNNIFRFVSSAWRVIISAQKYIAIRFLVMTNDFADHTGQYFHESKSKLEIKRYGRNSTIRVWVIYFIYILWNTLKQQPVLGAVSPEKHNWSERPRDSCLVPIKWPYHLQGETVVPLFSLVVKHRKSVQFGNIQSYTRTCS